MTEVLTGMKFTRCVFGSHKNTGRKRAEILLNGYGKQRIQDIIFIGSLPDIEVEKADFTNFCIDKAQTGLACVNSWGAIPLKKYRLPYQDYELSFIMTPVYHKIK